MARLAALLLLLHAVAAAPPAAPRTLVVHPGERKPFAVPRRHAALGVEFLNHEIYGGLSSQMVFGESFEEACECETGQASARDAYLMAQRARGNLRFTPPVSDVGFIGCAVRGARSA